MSVGGPMFPFFNAAVNETKATVRAGPTKLSHIEVSGVGAADAYLQIFDALIADVTVGVTAPTQSLFIPANGAMDKSWERKPMQFEIGVVIAVTGGPTNAVAPASAAVVNMGITPS